MTLQVSRLTLYKHGLGFFERSGPTESTFTLDLPRRAMDDVLKSLTIIPATGTVNSITFETPPDRNPGAQRQPLQIDPNLPLSTVMAALIGHRVAVSVGDQVMEGELLGLEGEQERRVEHALVSVLTTSGIRLVALTSISCIELVDATTTGDLRFALDARRSDNERAQASVTLSGATDVVVNYIAPAPSWRVSYRILVGEPSDNDGTADACDVYIQGWGLFDNTLEEDLNDIRLTLTAGMPVSFRYELHQPFTPDRPLVRDEARTVSAPIEFSRMQSESFEDGMQTAAPMAMMAAPAGGAARMRGASPKQLMESAPVRAVAEERGALFAFEIADPVSVRRGESGMVPILSLHEPGTRELLFNRDKQASHPAASIRFANGPLTLERGPATVLESGNYAGEAVVPFSPGGAPVILAFAVELGITVETAVSFREERRSLRIVDGSLFIGFVEYTETIYVASSDLANECTLTIEHVRTDGTELVDTPAEQTVGEARFTLPLAARGKSTFVVVERRESVRYEGISGMQGHQLAEYLREKLLDGDTYSALSSVLALHATTATLQQQLSTAEFDRQKLRARMDDTRKNLEPLHSVHDSALRSRFIMQLETLEDEMLALDASDRRLTSEIADIEHKIAAELARLSTTATGS